MSSNEQEHSSEQLLLLAGYRYALSLVQHEHDAEDLVQQACLKVFRAKGRLENKHYFLKTIRNLFYDRWRGRKRANATQLPDSGLEDPTPNQERMVAGKLDLKTVLESINHEHREVLYLNCVEGFSAEEISRMTGVPKGTVLSQLSRAKNKIRSRHEYEPYPENIH